MQPGQTVQPGGSANEPTWQYHSDLPAPQPEPPQPAPPAEPTPPTQQPAAAAPTPAPTSDTAITWTASEFIAHAKSAGWYFLLALGTVAAAAAIYFITKDKISTGVIVILGIIFGIAAARKPRELQYQVDERGIKIAGKDYPYQTFRSFSVVEEGGVESIWFMPLKRFMPIVSIYFDPNDGDKIANILSQALPFEDKQPDVVDRLMHRLRF